MPLLGDKWSPAVTCEKVVDAVTALMSEPNARDPLVPEAASLYITDRKAYDEKAREYTSKYAAPKPG